MEHDFRGIVHPGIASHHPAHASALRDDLVQETEGNPDLYGNRYRNLVEWEQKVHKMVNQIIKEYKKAWND